MANALPVTVDGHEAYGLDITQGTGYRDDNTKGIAVNGEPESMYMVASGSNVNSGCCFDFGNAETNNDDNGAGHMDAVNLTTYCEFSPCSGPGPWVEADMENGQYVSGDGSNPNDTSNDNEGVMTSGFASASTDAAVQASIVSAGYAGSASPSGPSAAGPTVVHAGYSSVYTVDASNGDLQETYPARHRRPLEHPGPVRELRHPGGGGLVRPAGGQPVNIRESAQRRRSPPD